MSNSEEQKQSAERDLRLPAPVELKAGELMGWFQTTAARYVIALSGGVDSAVVAKAGALAAESLTAQAQAAQVQAAQVQAAQVQAAQVQAAQAQAKHGRTIEVILATGDSPSLARQELHDAQITAGLVQLEHTVVATEETLRSDYQRNDGRRCYYCKSQLFETLEKKFPGAVIVTGTNADDLGDYRPGLVAASEHNVRAPLAELGLGKAEVRKLAELWELPLAEKPASPCLASRIAYGVEVTHERLAMVEQAEAYLRKLGLVEFRVRLHPGDIARIEAPLAELGRLVAEPQREELLAKLKSLGFRFVTLDLAGFASGSLNQLIQISSLK